MRLITNKTTDYQSARLINAHDSLKQIFRMLRTKLFEKFIKIIIKIYCANNRNIDNQRNVKCITRYTINIFSDIAFCGGLIFIHVCIIIQDDHLKREFNLT